MKLLLDGIYAQHIFFFAKMLNSEHIISSIKNYKLSNIYMNYVISVIKETGYHITADTLYNLINNISLEEKESNIIIDCNDLKTAEKEIFNIICPNISYNTCDQKTIEHTIQLFFNRPVTSHELRYHITNNKKHDMFTWMLILMYCQEGQNVIRHNNNINKNVKIAVIFCGHVRNFRYTIISQKKIINNPIFDIFCHTWDDIGIKNDRRNITKEWLNPNSAKLDIESIKQHYNPKKIKVENNKEMLSKLSLRNKINPIFLFAYQARDDATKYISSQLYSIYQGYKLVEEYEIENNIKYDGIIKLRFDFNINSINIDNIIDDITKHAVYWPHAKSSGHSHRGGGGGCVSCDYNIPHDDHTNDLCDVWYYANRELGQKISELYLHAENILRNNQEHNFRMLKEHPEIRHQKVDDFIYIESFDDIEKYIRAFYPEGLSRRYLRGIRCLSSMNICGRIVG
jgi:hypothetical protein